MIHQLDGVPYLLWNGHLREVVLNDSITDDLNIVSAIKLCLEYLNYSLSKVQVAGLTGAAFYIGWHAEHLGSGMGGSVFQYPHEGTRDLFQKDSYCGYNVLFDYVGVEHELLFRGDKGLWQRTIASLDENVPGIAVEWNPVSRRGHSAILCGYDSEKRVFLGRIYEHEKPDFYREIEPGGLHYVILLKPKQAGITKGELKHAYLESMESALRILQGGYFEDEEKWILGLGAYSKQAKLILSGMDPRSERYGLEEHFLFWRMQILYLCRIYALEYVRLLLSEPEMQDFYQPLSFMLDHYTRFLRVFESRLTIYSDIDSIMKGQSLFWKDDVYQGFIKGLFSTLEGRKRFGDFLLELGDIEKRVVSSLEEIAEIRQSM